MAFVCPVLLGEGMGCKQCFMGDGEHAWTCTHVYYTKLVRRKMKTK